MEESLTKLTRKLEKVIISYIPKHTTCRPEEQKRKYRREKEKNSILAVIQKHEMISVEYNNEWQKQDPDMSVCEVCKEVIFTTQYELKHYLNGEEIEREKPVKVCEPCYVKMEK